MSTIQDSDPTQRTILTECLHQDAVLWNPYNGVVQCHRCGVTFVPMQYQQQRCQFCGGAEGGIESQDMGDKRTMRLCGTCRGHIAQGSARARARMQARQQRPRSGTD